jgi:hypothetical protein
VIMANLAMMDDRNDCRTPCSCTSIAHIALHGLQSCAILGAKEEKEGMPPASESEGDAH